MARQHLLATIAIGTLAVACAFVPGSSPREGIGSVAPVVPQSSSVTLAYEVPGQGPASGAVVHFTLHTGREIEFRLDAEGQADVPREWLPLDVRVNLAGRLRHHLRLEADAPSTPIRFSLSPGAHIQGVVVNEAGTPLVGAQVRARPRAEQTQTTSLWETRTDSAGRFTFSTLPEGATWVHAAHPTYGSEETQLEANLDGGSEARIVLQPASLVSGRVVLPDGEPAEGAEVLFAGSGAWPVRSVEADASGAFEIPNLPAGVYSLRATLGDQTSVTQNGLILEQGQRVALVFRLLPGIFIRGIVRDRDSLDSLGNAQVIATEGALSIMPAASLSASDGSFSLGPLAPRSYRVRVMASNYVPVEIGFRSGDPSLQVEMTRACTVRGRVVDSAGLPVPGASLHVQSNTAQAGVTSSASVGRFGREVFEHHRQGGVPLHGGSLGVTLGAVPPIPVLPTTGVSSALAAGAGLSDGQGRFVLRGLQHGEIRLSASHSDYAPGLSTARTVGAGSDTDGWTITLQTGATITGRVLDSRGFPVAGVTLRAAAEGALTERITTSASDGSFTLGGLAGRTTLTVAAVDLPTLQEEYELTSGETRDVDLRLPEALIPLDGRVLTSQGFPVEGAKVTLASLNRSYPTRRWTLSASDGTFRLNGLPPGPYRIEVDHPAFAKEILERVDESADETRITLSPGGILRIRILDAWEAGPASGAEVLLRGPESREGSPDADGLTEFQRLPAGRYVISATRPGCLPGRVVAELPENPRQVVTLDLPPLELAPSGSIRGEVRDQYGEPVSDAEVTWRQPPRWEHASRTNAQGAFLLESVPPGPHRITARHPSAGISPSPSELRVRPREESPGVFIRLPGIVTEAEAGETLEQREGVAISLQNTPDGVVVFAVTSGSLAERAEITPGDRLLSVDGEPVFSAAHGSGMMRTEAGEEHRLTLLQGVTEREVIVRSELHTPPAQPD